MEKTINELLAEAGYSHGRNNVGQPYDSAGRHLIWETKTGKHVGYMTAHEACQFLGLEAAQ